MGSTKQTEENSMAEIDDNKDKDEQNQNSMTEQNDTKMPEDSIKQEQNMHLSHKKWRNLIKKQKRKEKRKAEAKTREEQEAQVQKSPDTLAREALEERQNRVKEEYQEKLRISQHLHWLDKERRAQEAFSLKQERIDREKQRRQEEEKKIREEWEKRQEQEEMLKQQEVKRKQEQEELLKEATKHEKKPGESPWHNPLAPETRPGIERDPCPFYVKVGVCRFGDRCSRAHQYPESSTTLLFPGMYSHFKLEHSLKDEYDTDLGLEYEDSETYQHFRDFFHDTLPEFQKYGKVVQFKVCCNEELHLRGNVYVQFADEESALQAFMNLNGRWYGGRQLQCQLCVVEKWRHAICGVFSRNRCPKGRNCNFIHAFRNPGNMFWEADRDIPVTDRYSSSRRGRHDRRSRSRSPSRMSSRSHRRSRTPERRGSRSYRSPSRMSSRSNRNRSRSRSPRRRSRSPRNRSRSPKRSSRSVRRSKSPSRQRSRSRSPKRRSRSPRRSRSSRKSRSPSRSHRRSRSHSRSPTERHLDGKSSKKTSSNSVSSKTDGDTVSALFCVTPPYVDVDTTPEYHVSGDEGVEGGTQGCVGEDWTERLETPDRDKDNGEDTKDSEEREVRSKDRKKNYRKRAKEEDERRYDRSCSRDRSERRSHKKRKYRSHGVSDDSDSSSADEKSRRHRSKKREKKSKRGHRAKDLNDRRDRSYEYRHIGKQSTVNNIGDKYQSNMSSEPKHLMHKDSKMNYTGGKEAGNDIGNNISGKTTEEKIVSDKKGEKSSRVLKKLSFKVKKKTEMPKVADKQILPGVFQDGSNSSGEEMIIGGKSEGRPEQVYSKAISNASSNNKESDDEHSSYCKTYSKTAVCDKSERNLDKENSAENVAKKNYFKNKTEPVIVERGFETEKDITNCDMDTKTGSGKKIAELLEEMPQKQVCDSSIVGNTRNKGKALEFLDSVIADIENT